jgi:hypothetical protein
MSIAHKMMSMMDGRYVDFIKIVQKKRVKLFPNLEPYSGIMHHYIEEKHVS